MDCFAKYVDGIYYPAKVIQKNECTVTVKFTLDRVTSKVLEKNILDTDTLWPGLQCLALHAETETYDPFIITNYALNEEDPAKTFYFGTTSGGKK